MKQYSVDLRERVLRAIDAGLAQTEAARLFGVGHTTIKRWKRRRRDTGDLAPQPRPGRPPRIGTAQFPALEAQVRAVPDATLAAHCAVWRREQGTAVSPATMSRVLTKLGWPLKKRRSSRPSGTRPSALPGVPRPPISIRPPSCSSMRVAPTPR